MVIGYPHHGMSCVRSQLCTFLHSGGAVVWVVYGVDLQREKPGKNLAFV
ncbi:hypothetical protein [Escherichia phage AV124]|nr:hypothetical protein [Escherichia phage AV124]